MCTQIWAVNVLYSAQGNLPIWWGNIPTHRKLGSSLGKRIPPCFWKGMWKWSAIWKHIRGPFESQRIFWIARFLQVIYNFSLLPCQKVKKKMHFLDIYQVSYVVTVLWKWFVPLPQKAIEVRMNRNWQLLSSETLEVLRDLILFRTLENFYQLYWKQGYILYTT